MTHAHPFGVEGTLGRSGMVIMPARPGTGDPDDLVFRVVLLDRKYFLGEPILVHCQVINETQSPLIIPYQYSAGHKNAQIFFTIRTASGEHARPINRPRIRSFGPPPITIPPGHQFVHTINLAWDYAIVEAGDYVVIAEYNSDGNYYEFDPAVKRGVAKPAWEGRLVADVGQIEVQEPAADDDRQALEMLLEGVSHYRPHLRYSVVLSSLTRERVIAKFPHSRYSAYIRFNLAHAALGRDRWKNPDRARDALPHLEYLSGINWVEYPSLFRERVLHRLILAHVGAGSDAATLRPLVEEFRQEFPDSPYELPDAARQAAP